MTPAAFRRIALGMQAAVEGSHMGHPDFRVNNRIFASLHDGDRFGMVKLTPEQQHRCLQEHSQTFAPESGAWGRAGCTRVHLASADEEAVGEAMTLAWQNVVSKTSKNTAGARKKKSGARRRSSKP